MTDNQGSLFETAPPPWELDDHDDWLAARVVFASAPFGPYDYSIPSQFEQTVTIGKRIEVPFGKGNRKMVGYCIAVISPGSPLATSVNPNRLKPILGVLDPRPIIAPTLLALAHWIADYYLCQLGVVIETIVPTGVRSDAGTRELIFLSLGSDAIAAIEQGVLSTDAELAQRAQKNCKLSKLQVDILRVMVQSEQDWTLAELADTVGCTAGPISTMRKRQLLLASSKRVQQKTHEIDSESRTSDLNLNDEQAAALEAIASMIDQHRYRTFLMHGITGSGKTEVYIRAIQQVVSHGKQAIVLVPEISLTPQTRQRFRARFDRVAVLHSHLTAAQRAWHWQEIAAGRVQVIIGARSAIFAPTPNLGLIVLDEEHDGSFKQDKAPRYHARDVAQWRAEHEKVPLILGSATPSLETWQKACDGRYQNISLTRRVHNRPLPDVAAIDLRIDFAGERRMGPISQKLRLEIQAALASDGQVILLLNRRGFSTRIQCPGCGHVEYCPDCSIPLTHHQSGSKAVCHYCDYQIPEPRHCSQCRHPAIRFSGLGTQKLEAHVAAMFPDVPLMRMDTDTMQKPGSHEKTLAQFRDGEIKILLGTQMIAKGLDFPNVTLVGVINADTGLHLPDFRASERTFGLITQVAGRTGRGSKGGRVLVQSFNPDHVAIQSALTHDYLGFAAKELPQRRAFHYPPFGYLARIVVRGESQAITKLTADQIVQTLNEIVRERSYQVVILGPAVCPIEKLRGLFRFHVMLNSVVEGELQRAIRGAENRFQIGEGVQWIVDIDPQDMI